ncbi:hypothetical protein FRC19_006858 [Serendipita sp. 401]|nr:hypothetical protein FRC19_006858 [Serendipita sp. 401]KAG8810058.1 hypothetical protein FRC18_004264 [Serendipita sp. 400]KAG9019055.1 hypothetical protein FS842_007936 [Serendipita sp. 407]
MPALDRASPSLKLERFPLVYISETRKISFGVHIPNGFSFGMPTVEYRACYQLDAKVTVTHQAIYHFQGQLQQATSRFTLTGPIPAKEYIYRNEFDLWAVTVSPCGTNTVLAINSAVLVIGNKPNSEYLCTDVWDPPSPLKQTFAFSWSKC